MRRMACAGASRHWLALSFRTNPESNAATKTPVPAADSQLMAKRAASGFALTGATGGARCTRLCSAGISQTGKDNVPWNGDPRSVVLNVTLANRVFKNALNCGMPHKAQHAIRITHGSQA